MSARNPRSAGNAGNAGNTRNARAWLPLFTAEIQVYVKINAKVEAALTEKQRTNPSTLPAYFQRWDLDLRNDTEDYRVLLDQRLQVIRAIEATINGVLGEDNGWKCEWDATMNNGLVQLPGPGLGPEPKKWWGVEIVTPPMSVSKQWQLEINMVFEALGRKFDFWTNDFCKSRVQIKPGPAKETRYTLDQLVRIAKGAYFWERALSGLVPANRVWDDSANPNHTIFAANEYSGIPNHGWDGVFTKIDSAATTEFKLLDKLQGGEAPGGIASAMSTIRGILLAITLQISALRYDFDGARNRELAGCIKKLPETCHVYAGRKRFTVQQINIREEAFRKGLPPPDQTSYKPYGEEPATAARVPAAREAVAQGTQGTIPATQGRGGASGRGGGGQSSSTPSRTSAPQGGRGGGASGRGGGSSTPSQTPAPQGGRGGGGGASGRGGAGQSSSTAAARPPPAATTPASAGASTRPSAARGGGNTTRLPERPAASASRTQASSSNTNTTAAASAAASGQRRRRQGEGDTNA
ncbi:hypothetical protein B0I37DRAFT_400069 [Chaetomium sp. MPI-CAGE-AT-0009]|nr:hypothetical protein B0I37DRAFT_400069 [Chaetomium sp. MPI-CAGE-AT-0009]